MDDSRMRKEISIVISKYKTVNRVSIYLEPIQSARAPVRTWTSFPSGIAAERITVGSMLDKYRKIEENNCVRMVKSRNESIITQLKMEKTAKYPFAL